MREDYEPTSDDARPLIVWEPHAKSCYPETLTAHAHAARLAIAFSPNHEELQSFFGPSQEGFSRAIVEQQASTFLSGAKGGCIIVRAAEHGCLIMSSKVGARWLPAYYTADLGKVVDPTGAGNAFLGAFAVGFQATHDYIEAAAWGTIAASFVIEQVGLPKLQKTGDREVWNGCDVAERLRSYKRIVGLPQ